jgi:nitronate monooxygenase
MAGGATTPELVAAVSNAGGLGMIAGAYLTADQIADSLSRVRTLTSKPFGINLFAGGYASHQRDPVPDPSFALNLLSGIHSEMGLPAPTLPDPIADPFADQLAAILADPPPIFSFTFGIPDRHALDALARHDILTIGTATTVHEGKLLEAAGVDAIVAQGSEAGAHRGTFAAPFASAMIGTMALVPQVVDAVGVPVIASGGIADGRGIIAALALGATAVQMGTAFLTCTESGTTPVHKQAIRSTPAELTTVTRAFSGRPARGIENDYLRAWYAQEERALPFPLQNELTRPMRSAASRRGDTRYLSLWCGQAGPLARDLSATDLMRQLVSEMRDTQERLHGEG